MSEDRPDDEPPPRSSGDPAPSGTSDPDGAPTEGEGAPTDGEGAKAEGAPTDGEGAKAEGAPADGEGAKTDGEGAKAEGEGPGKAGPRRRRRRLAILTAALIVTIVGAVAIKWTQHRRSSAPSALEADGSGAVTEAPRGPGLPGHPDGVRLSGHVIDGTGAPVAGAEVTAEPERGVVDRALSTTPRDGASGSGGSAAGGSAAGGGGSGSAGAGTGTGSGAAAPVVTVAPATGADGRFVLEGLVPGRYRLRVTGPGLVPAEVRYVPVPSDELRILISRQVRIDGTVTDGGDPVPNAVVGLRGEAIGGEIETRTDAQGEFQFPELPEGRYQIYAYQGALAARAIRLSRLGAGPFPPVELRFEPAAIVVGRVIDRDEGTGVVAAVELRPSGDDQAPRFARSGEDGVFRIEGVPNGRWIADAFAPGYTSPGGVEMDAGRGVPELALVRGATIEGRVLDGEGRPIEGASVRAMTGEGSAAQEHSAAVDGDRLRRYSGRTAAPAPPMTGLATDDPTFIARGELGVTVGPIPPLPPLGAAVGRPATIDPTVTALAGEPPPLAIDPARVSIWTTGPDGRYRIRGLPKGKTSVLAAAAGFAEGRSRPVALEPTQMVTGVDITLTPGTILFGRVTDQHKVPVLGAQVTARPEVGAVILIYTEPDGTYRIGPVTGTVELSASAYGHADAKRTITLAPATGRAPAERREDLVLAVADATLAGILEDATGATVAGGHLEVIGGSGDGRHAIAAADGTFSIDMLPDGPLRVRVKHPGYPTTELDAAATPGGKTTSRLRIPLGGAVEGVLLDDHSGDPLGGLTVGGTGPRGREAEATTEANGRWKLGPLVPGRWKIIVKLPGYLPLARELDVPAARAPGESSVRDIRLDLRRGALVGGTVRDARGNRLPGARVTVQAADGTGPIAEGTTDVAGEFRIRDAPTGELAVTATRNDARAAIRATVRPGDEVLGLSIDLP